MYPFESQTPLNGYNNYSVPNYNFTPYVQPTIPQPQVRQSSSIVWVQGEDGAQNYSVAPGNTVLLMDSSSNKFYIKSSDIYGKPTIRVYSYEEEVKDQQKASDAQVQNDYVSRDEFNALKKQIDDLMS